MTSTGKRSIGPTFVLSSKPIRSWCHSVEKLPGSRQNAMSISPVVRPLDRRSSRIALCVGINACLALSSGFQSGMVTIGRMCKKFFMIEVCGSGERECL